MEPESEESDVRSMMNDLNQLKVSPKVKKVLLKNGVSSVEELQNKTREQLLDYRGVGPIYALQLEQALKDLDTAEFETDGTEELGLLTLELSKALIKPARAISWCPKYDLVAMILEEPPTLTVEVRRLNWEVLISSDFTIPVITQTKEPTSIVNLTWSPDCNHLFIGTEKCVFSYDVSKGIFQSAQTTFKLSYHPFVWSTFSGPMESNCTTRTGLLPEPVTVKKSRTSTLDMNKIFTPQKFVPLKTKAYPERLRLLITPGQGAELFYDAFGMYRVMCLKFVYAPNLNPPVGIAYPPVYPKDSDPPSQDFEIIRFGLSDDYSLTSVLLHDNRNDEQYLICVRHPVLQMCNHEISFISSTVLQMNDLLHHIMDSFTYVSEPWKSLIDPFKKRIKQLELMMTEAGCPPKSIPTEILRAFTLGSCDTSVFNRWLLSHLKPRKLLQLDQKIQPVTNFMSETVERIMLRSVDEILMRLTELLGIARNKSQLSCLGLSEESILKIIDIWKVLRKRLYDLQINIITTAKYYHSIIRWLLMVWGKRQKEGDPPLIPGSTESPFENLDYTPELANDIIHFINYQIFNDNLQNFMVGNKTTTPRFRPEWTDELMQGEKSSKLDNHSIVMILGHCKKHNQVLQEMLCRPLLVSCTIDTAHLTSQILRTNSCCFYESFNYTNSRDTCSPQFFAWLPSQANTITLFFCQFLIENDFETRSLLKGDPWGDEIFLRLKDMNQDSLRFRCSICNVVNLPFPLEACRVDFYNNSTLLLLGQNQNFLQNKMGMVIELPLATFDDWQSLPVRKGNIQGVVKELLSLGHEDECMNVNIDDLRFHQLAEVPRMITSSSKKGIMAVLGDNGNCERSQMWIFDMLEIEFDEDDEVSGEEE